MTMQILHWLAGLIVVAEALNKLERTCPRATHLSRRERLVEVLQALAWGLLAVGGAGAVMTPLLRLEPASLQDMCIVVGFAILIIRTRVEEGL